MTVLSQWSGVTGAVNWMVLNVVLALLTGVLARVIFKVKEMDLL
jgi:hypothetical protein